MFRREQGLWIREDTLDGVKSIKLEEWSSDVGNKKIAEKGGWLKMGDDYASKFMAVYPMQKLAQDGKSFMMKMKVQKSSGSDTYIYHSTDMKTWSRVSGVSMEGGTATFQASMGMY